MDLYTCKSVYLPGSVLKISTIHTVVDNQYNVFVNRSRTCPILAR